MTESQAFYAASSLPSTRIIEQVALPTIRSPASYINAVSSVDLPPVAAHTRTSRVNNPVDLSLNNVTRERTTRGSSHTERQNNASPTRIRASDAEEKKK